MRIYIALIFSLLISAQNADGQNVPTGNNSVSGSSTFSVLAPNAYNSLPNNLTTSSPFNYVRKWEPEILNGNPYTIDENTPPSEATMTATYYNGSGQVLQTIMAKSIPGNKDLITVNDNRPSSRQVTYLPYSASSTGKFRLNGFAEQANFYSTKYPDEDGLGYSVIQPYANGNDRGTVNYQPGKASLGQQRGTITISKTDMSTGIRIWELNSNGMPETSSNYPQGALTSTSVKSLQSGNTYSEKITYVDLEGKIVCEKVIESNASILTTYYVYDDYNRLVYTLLPKAVEMIDNNNGLIAPQVLSELCDKIVYDELDRIIEKYTHGLANSECIVYDRFNRPVLTQSPQQKIDGKWTFTIYDKLGRVRITGIYTTTQSRQNLQTSHNNPGVHYLSYGVNTSALPYYTAWGNWNGQATPTSLTDCDIWSVKYYDSYAELGYSNAPFDITKFDNEHITTGGAVPPIETNRVNGMMTGEKVKVIKDNSNTTIYEFAKTIYCYDDRGRIIQKKVYHQMSGPSTPDYYSYQYDFKGRILREIDKHSNPNCTTKPTTNVYKRYEYDNTTHNLTKVKMKIDNDAWEDLSVMQYNDLGQLSSQNLGTIEGRNYLYNIKGQMTYINKDYVEQNSLCFSCQVPSFGEAIFYDRGFQDPQYGGNISGVIWKGFGSSSIRSYGYTYDALNRLKGAEFREWSMGGGTSPSWNKTNLDFTTDNLTYDKNGNLLSMKQMGMGSVNNGPITPMLMDDLNYHYENNGVSDRLVSVTDAVSGNPPTYFADNGAVSSSDYNYDANGNLTADANKSITNVTYNYLNKVEYASFSSGNNIRYSYLATTGDKLQDQITTGTSTRKIDYIGSFVYEDNKLSYILTGYGRVRVKPVYPVIFLPYKYSYDYFILDHLGNVRSVITAEPVSTKVLLATHEVASSNLENLIFTGIDEVREDNPFVTDPNNVKAATLNSNKQVGTSVLLHMMAGDKFQVSSQSYYDNYDPSSDNVSTGEALLNSLLTNLLGGNNGYEGGEAEGQLAYINRIFSPTDFINSYESLLNGVTDVTKPRAYLNYLVFDENMKLVSTQSGAIQVSQANSWETLSSDQITIGQNGYLLVYIGNMSNLDVSFDNVNLQVDKGILLEENHYYPYGLAISLGSQNPIANRLLYQNKYSENSLGLMWSDFDARQYDPQTGRFLSYDPAGQYASGYVGMGNNPVSYIDPSGKIAFVPILIGVVAGAYMGGVAANNGEYNPGDWTSNRTAGYMLGGALVGGLSAGAGAAVAGGGGIMANTLGIMASSFVNSVGTHLYTGGQSEISISFGAGSYNLSTGKVRGIWNWGDLSGGEKIGYSLGALTNLRDLGVTSNMLFNVEKHNAINHAAIADKNGHLVVSYGPNSKKIVWTDHHIDNRTVSNIKHYSKLLGGVRGTNSYPISWQDGARWLPLNNVNETVITGYGNALSWLANRGFAPYSFLYSSCSTHAGLAMWAAGVPNLFIHPYTLQASIWLWNTGITPGIMANSHMLQNNYGK